MPQFGLLAVPVFVIMYLLSGSATPRESMPLWLQHLMLASPSTHYTQLAQGILYRAAGADVVWPQMLSVAGIGVVFLGLAILWYERYIKRLKVSDPKAAADELRPSAEQMLRGEYVPPAEQGDPTPAS